MLCSKIDALDAVLADKAATPGEKENAAALKIKLQNKLQTEFPGAMRPSKAPPRKNYID